MSRSGKRMNTVYISERVQECLRPISGCAMTAIVAPMGYGKTTAASWYLSDRERAENALVIRVSIYADNLQVFWKRVQNAFRAAGVNALDGFECPEDKGEAALLTDEICFALDGDRPCYIFLDDFHLLRDDRAVQFLCELASRLPENVHIIAASRDRFLRPGDVLRLGGRLHRIGAEQLRLNHTEISVYSRRCGTELTDEQTDRLLRLTEGWFSAVYLNLCSVAERGELLDGGTDIYDMFTSALIEPLGKRERLFLAVMSIVDEFTPDMARFMTGMDGTDAVLAGLTEQNAFVTRLPGGETYRFHHMMKTCAGRLFDALGEDERSEYLHRYAQWLERHGQYLGAAEKYMRCGDEDAVLRVIASDTGVMLAALRPEELLDTLSRVSERALVENPLAILVLMRRLFTIRQIPKMLELRGLLVRAAEENAGLSDEERGNLLGECELIMSFLMYNDISEMSRLHRSASLKMTHPAVSLRSYGSWTFGSPSVLMMFHREPGSMDTELAQMDECMPHYYRITENHGFGAELVMHAEAELNRGSLAAASVALERARCAVASGGQENMALCCDFLALRLRLFGEGDFELRFADRRRALIREHSPVMLNMLDSIEAWRCAALDIPDAAPEAFRCHALDGVNYLAPGRPMMQLIENQLMLAQGEYARLAGRAPALFGVCGAMHYELVSLHLTIQLAAAYERMGDTEKARSLVSEALEHADPDGLVIPFAENYRYLAGIYESFGERLAAACALGRRLEEVCRAERARRTRPAAASGLTEREMQIARLAAERATNREIAERLFLSEGTVKQYINAIYSKLAIDGDTRTKRARLAQLLSAEG